MGISPLEPSGTYLHVEIQDVNLRQIVLQCYILFQEAGSHVRPPIVYSVKLGMPSSPKAGKKMFFFKSGFYALCGSSICLLVQAI